MTDTVTVDLSTWTRRQEVEDYAKGRGIPVEEAIEILVNVGLSHGG